MLQRKHYDENTNIVEWTDYFIESKKAYTSWTYYNNMKGLNRNHIERYLKNTSINQLLAIDINNMLCELAKFNPNTKKPASKKLLKSISNLLLQTMDFAIENGIKLENTRMKTKIPKYATKTERRALTKDERSNILSINDKRICPAILLMMFAGLRVGEILPLKWDDIDFINGIVSINKSVAKIATNQYMIKTGTKNGKSRKVPIPKLILNRLSIYKNTDSLITAKMDGSLHTPSSWRRLWNTFVSNDIIPHMLRHTYATILYTSGVDVLTASKLMGHSNVKTTLAIYTHLEECTYKASIDKLERKVEEIF